MSVRSNGIITLTVTPAAVLLSLAVSVNAQCTFRTVLFRVTDSCPGADTGIVDMDTFDGVQPYDWRWSRNGQPTGLITEDLRGVGPGSYTVTANDAAGCVSVAGPFEVGTSPLMVVATSSTAAGCATASDGTASVTVTSGGTAPFRYAWSTGATTSTITGQPANTYVVTVTDLANCAAVRSVTIGTTTPIIVQGSITNVACGTTNTGGISTTVSGGNPGYTYAWSGPNGFTSSQSAIGSLAVGAYTVTVSDITGPCSSSMTFQVGGGGVITIDGSVTNVLCHGAATGTISTLVGGGVGPYTYAWSDGPATTPSRAALTQGTYTVTATDANGCSNSRSFTVQQPANALLATATISPPLCAGQSTGSISLSTEGGTPGYTFAWSNSATTATVTALAPGSYHATVTDANLCVFITPALNVFGPSPVTVTTSAGDASCANGSADGFVSASASGGAGSFTYLWNNGATSARVDNVGPATYSVTATDANGCTGTGTAMVSRRSSIVLSNAVVVNNACRGTSVGSISFTTEGGTAPYTYAWTGPGGFTSSAAALANLAAGDYAVTVTDANASPCSRTSVFTVQQPAVALAYSATPRAVSCAGGSNGAIDGSTVGGEQPYTYAWSNSRTTQSISGLTQGTFTVTVRDALGCTLAPQEYTVTQPLPMAVTGTPQPSCFNSATGSIATSTQGGVFPYTWAWNNGAFTANIGSVAAGDYRVTVTDTNGCQRVSELFSVPARPQQTASFQVTNTQCGLSTGAITLTAGGGTPGYTYLWNTLATTATISGLAGGSYSVTITDTAGCSLAAAASVATGGGGVAFTGVVTNVLCRGAATGSVAVTLTSGTPPVSWSWINSAGVLVSTSRNLVNALAGTYTLSAVDSNGCSGAQSFTINQPASSVSSVLTPVAATCFGATGSVTSTTAGGTPFAGGAPYTYSWSTGSSASSLSNVAAGQYQLTATDANGCSATTGTEVTQPAAVTVTTSSTDTACGVNTATGTATANVVNAVGATTYVWSTLATTRTISGLSAGSYRVTATDSNGCSGSATAEVSARSAVLVSTTVTNARCGNANTGSIGTTVSGGVAPYSYAWTGPNGFTSSNATLVNLAGGTYALIVTDASISPPCVRTASVVVEQPAPLLVATNTTRSQCPGATGTAIATTTGGVAPYTYRWSNSATTAATSGLAQGLHTVTVTDSTACATVASANVACDSVCAPLYSACEPTGLPCCDGGRCARHARSCSTGPAWVCVGNVIVL